VDRGRVTTSFASDVLPILASNGDAAVRPFRRVIHHPDGLRPMKRMPR
jgi:hypothetical protein